MGGPGDGGMMDAKIEGTPFGVLMQQAVKLKTHVHKVDRVKFDRWPKFYQNTAFIKDEQKRERAMAYPERMEAAQRYKAEGDAWFRKGDPLQASLNYEWCAGLFRWATTLDPNWRKKSVDDDDILEESFDGSTDAERGAIRSLTLACYLNIARAYFKQKEWTTARQACDWALRLEPSSDKALLLRATVLVEPLSHGSTERDAAIVDLELAEASLAGASAAAAARDDLDDDEADRLLDDVARRKKEVARLLSELRRLRALGKEQDRAYGGMFERGAVYGADEAAERKARDAAALAAVAPPPDDRGAPVEAGDGNFSATPGPEAELAAAEKLLVQYEAEGRTKDATELRDGLRDAKAKLAKSREKGPPPMDFKDPTPEMVADAKKRGIDLQDPAVIDMLESLQREQRETATPEGRERKKVRDAATAKAQAMPMRALIKALAAMGVDHAHCDTKTQLQALYVLAAEDVDAAKSAAANERAKPPQKRADPEVGSWKYTVAFATVFLAYRMWSMNLLGPILGDLFGFGAAEPDDAAAAKDDNPYGDEPAFVHHDWTSEF